MLDYDALAIQFDKLLATFTAQDLQDWIDFDKQRLADEALEEMLENLDDDTYHIPLKYKIFPIYDIPHGYQENYIIAIQETKTYAMAA